MRVVTGFDGSKSSTAALVWGAQEAQRRGVPLITVVALDDRSDLAFLDQKRPMAQVQVAAQWTEAVQRVTGDVPVDVRVLHGNAVEALTTTAAADDLLVVGSRGRTPFAGLLLGSVSRACLLHARCDVVIVRRGRNDRATPPTTHGRVIVGVDGSAYARAALRKAADEARLRGAELDAVYAVAWVPVGFELITPPADVLHDWGASMLAAELEATGVAARPVVVDGHAAEALVERSAQADLLVVGSRGHHPLPGLLIGSISDYCARNAACPIMVVRHAERCDEPPSRPQTVRSVAEP